ncbi:MAG TPA: FeoB small GTPase domain-containing protein, partial [Bacillota bacterium]|nr:FeoB small GTPase domain-containing protein [Bacillota bacterium]
MGLTLSSTGLELLKSQDQNPKTSEGTVKVALLGNPNTGKSTVFNALTGLKQHTGNWPG